MALTQRGIIIPILLSGKSSRFWNAPLLIGEYLLDKQFFQCEDFVVWQVDVILR